MDLVSKLKTPTSSDKTNNLFKVVDDINGNFKEKLAEAQANQDPEATKEKKSPDKTQNTHNEEASTADSKVESSKADENHNLDESKEVLEETIDELNDNEEADAQNENEEGLDGDETAHQNLQDEPSEESEDLNQEQNLEDQADPESEQDGSEEDVEPQEEVSLEAEQNEVSEEGLDGDEHVQQNIKKDGDEESQTSESKIKKASPDAQSQKQAPIEKINDAPNQADSKIKSADKAIVTEELRTHASETKASNSNQVSESKTLLGSPNSTNQVIEKVALNELSGKASTLEGTAINLDEESKGKLELSLREASAESESAKGRETLLQTSERSSRIGSSSGQPTTDMQPLNKVLEGLNQVANQIDIKKPSLEKLSSQLLQSVNQTYNLSKGGQAASLNPNINPKLSGNSPALKQFSTGQSDFQSDRLNELKDKVMQQVKHHLKLAMKNGVGEVKMRLNPQFLGGMKVNLILGQNDISATFLVENQSVKEILQRSLHNLEQTLSEKGIDVDRIEVKVSSEELSHESQQESPKNEEDLKVKRQWVNSFRNFGSLGAELDMANGSASQNSDEHELNIVA